ncbi:MAG TPA: cytochrome c3 family protein [Candidatus Desulfobacillus sp.]|nr:cytochrome c3 family protein [Candidatus Desulfobacillus sp.]
MTRQDWIIAAVILAMVAAIAATFGIGKPAPAHGANPAAADYLRAAYSPLHFKPDAGAASDAQCLACHREVLEDRVRPAAQAGIKADESKAWYQRLSTYAGEQDTFHRRHLATPLAKSLMNLECNTCHEGHDPREEAPGSSADNPQDTTAFTLRKQVNPETTCLKCHGQMPDPQIMGLPGPWPEIKEQFQNNCLICHESIRSSRHQVRYLNAQAIEDAAKTQGGDVCYGCHGGRAWYRIAYPYPRNAWPNMPGDLPAWAKDRPTHSEPRFAKRLDRNLQPQP